jgi:antitoxin component of MazEF toxin-antitoxin module
MHLRRRLLKWGNGYGIRITKKEAQQLGVKAGNELDVKVDPRPVGEELEELPSYRFGGDYDLDAIVEEDLDAGH